MYPEGSGGMATEAPRAAMQVEDLNKASGLDASKPHDAQAVGLCGVGTRPLSTPSPEGGQPLPLSDKRKEMNAMFISFSCGCLARTRTRKCGTKNRCVTITLQGNPYVNLALCAKIAVQNYCFFLNRNLFITFFCDS